MLDINMYSIIVSKVFHPTVGDKKKFAIVVDMLYNYNQIIEKKGYN